MYCTFTIPRLFKILNPSMPLIYFKYTSDIPAMSLGYASDIPQILLYGSI